MKYYRTVIRDSYPGWPSIRAKATPEVSNALKLRHAPSWSLSRLRSLYFDSRFIVVKHESIKVRLATYPLASTAQSVAKPSPN